MAKKNNTAKNTLKGKYEVIKDKSNDLSKLIFENKLVSIIIAFLLISMVTWYAYDVRYQSVDLNGLDERIEANLLNQVQQIILQDIQSQYPNVQNQEFLQSEVIKRYTVALETRELTYQGQTLNLDTLIEEQTQLAKNQFQDDNGNTYLTAIDPYHFLKLSENYLENGHTGTNYFDGESIIEYKLAPEHKYKGTETPQFHVWLSAKLIGDSQGSFTENASLIFTLSSIIAALSVIPIFLFVRMYTNNVVALFSALILVSIGTFVSRTTAGFVDTDAYNILFPLFIAASIFGSFISNSNLFRLLFSVISGIFTGLFLWAWGSGWFFIIFVLTSLLGYLLYLFVIRFFDRGIDKKLISYGFVLLSYFISSFLFVYLFTKENLLLIIHNGVFSQLSGNIGNIASSSIWPNVFSSVAELNPASFTQIIGSVGGEFIFILALIGLVFLVFDFKSEDSQIKKATMLISIVSVIWFVGIISGGWFISLAVNSKLLFLLVLFFPVGLALLISLFAKNTSYRVFIVMLLSVWMAGTIYMSLNGVRFILLLAPAFAIAAGTGLYYIAEYINRYISKEFDIKNKIKQVIPGYVVVSIIFLTIFSPMYTQAYAIGNNAMPNFDDAWYEAMYKIENETSSDAIITSWWDFGHFFAAVGDRGVTFDGGSQTTPQSHWVGKLLLEGNEDVSVDILRMLVCGGNQAFDTAFDISQDPTNGVHTNEMLYDTFGKSIQEKREVISNYKYYNFTESDIDSIMQYLHCVEPRENLVITSGDMVGKTGVWAHWGSWDFTKKYVHDNYNKRTVSEIASVLDKNESLIETYVTELRAIDLNARTQNINREQLINQWFAPYPTYGETVPCQLENTTLVCGGQLGIDLLTGGVTNADALGVSINNVVMPAPSNLRVYNQNENGGVDILVTQSQSGFQIMLMQAPLGTSLFTKLYMLNGIGTTKFEEFHTTQTQTAGKVSIWKTNFGEVAGETSLGVNSVEYTVSGEELEGIIEESN